MLLVGLTGGIGSGKSTVARMLLGKGAVVVDADDLARRAVEPGSSGLVKLVDQFGPGILDSEGKLDRARMAAEAFGNPEIRAKLESVVHPEVARLLAEELERHRDTREVVVYSVPLLVERGLQSMMDIVVVVSAPEAVRIERMVGGRAMSEEDVRRRMAVQAGDTERAAVADLAVDNSGTIDELEVEVDRLWAHLVSRAEERQEK